MYPGTQLGNHTSMHHCALTNLWSLISVWPSVALENLSPPQPPSPVPPEAITIIITFFRPPTQHGHRGQQGHSQIMGVHCCKNSRLSGKNSLNFLCPQLHLWLHYTNFSPPVTEEDVCLQLQAKASVPWPFILPPWHSYSVSHSLSN